MRRDCPEFVPPALQFSEENAIRLTEMIDKGAAIESKSPTLRGVAGGLSFVIDLIEVESFRVNFEPTVRWDKNGTIWRCLGLFRVVPQNENPNKNAPNCPELS